jgi:hypothetical protein
MQARERSADATGSTDAGRVAEERAGTEAGTASADELAQALADALADNTNAAAQRIAAALADEGFVPTGSEASTQAGDASEAGSVDSADAVAENAVGGGRGQDDDRSADGERGKPGSAGAGNGPSLLDRARESGSALRDEAGDPAGGARSGASLDDAAARDDRAALEEAASLDDRAGVDDRASEDGANERDGLSEGIAAVLERTAAERRVGVQG